MFSPSRAILTFESTSACATALDNIISSAEPGINCIAPGALNEVFSQARQNASLEVISGAIDAWLTEMCGVGFCRFVPTDIIELR